MSTATAQVKVRRAHYRISAKVVDGVCLFAVSDLESSCYLIHFFVSYVGESAAALNVKLAVHLVRS